ncbi:MAG: hypothetical protein ACI9JM_002543 [Halioglobus sp.]|jgi:hypothetical protein
MKKTTNLAALIAMAIMVAAPQINAEPMVASMGVYVYPAAEQAPEQQSKDDYECFNSAKEMSHYDPMNPPEVVAVAPEQGPSGARLKGAARGAAGGAIIGEIANDDAGDGAAVGATLGALRGGRQSRQQKSQQAAAAEQAVETESAAMVDQFKNAYSACMEARKYSVKF